MAVAPGPASRIHPRGPETGQARPRVRSKRRTRLVAGLVAVLVVLLLVGGGGYLATRQLYFVGTNSQGIVTIYRGLPYELPAGIPLYETYLESGVPASLVPADRRQKIFNNDLRSQSDALNLVRSIELGKVSR